jgi:hypothetical protein
MASKNARAKRKHKEQQDILQAEHNRRQKQNPLPTINDPYGADVVSLDHTSLGQLRLNYRPQHDKVMPHRVTHKVRREYGRGEFRTIHASDRHTLIHGFDNATLVYRVPASDSVRNETLLRSIQNLPAAITDDYDKGMDRGQFNRRHYCVWCSYAQEPFVSKQFTKDGEAAVEFMRMTEPIWEEMTTHLQALFPLAYKEFTSIPLESHLRRMCGAWMGCVVNYQDDDGETGPVVTPPHRDVKERVFGVSCLCPFGDWEGGNLILWELKLIIELRPGDLLFFPDALIHHSNEAVAVGGQRNSVVAFTQQNMFDYWKRQDGQGAIKIGDSEFTDFPPALGDDDYAEGVAPPQNLRSGREYDGSRIVHTLDDKRMKQLKQRRRQENRRKKAAADAKTVPRFYKRLMRM